MAFEIKKVTQNPQIIKGVNTKEFKKIIKNDTAALQLVNR